MILSFDLLLLNILASIFAGCAHTISTDQSRGGALTCCVNVSNIHSAYEPHL